MVKYILYKKPIEIDTLYIVQYAYNLGKDIQPECCIEREWVVEELPSIYDKDTNSWYIGKDKVIEYYEEITGIKDITKLAYEFKKKNPNYRIKQ